MKKVTPTIKAKYVVLRRLEPTTYEDDPRRLIGLTLWTTVNFANKRYADRYARDMVRGNNVVVRAVERDEETW